MEILPGDVLFVWGHDLVEEVVEWVTHGPSHCALFLDCNTLAEANVGKKTGETLLSDYVSSNKKLEVWRDESLTPQDKEQIVIFAKSIFGTSYDYLAILVELLRFEANLPITSFREGKKRICSSYVYNCAKSVGKEWTKIKTPAPVDLLGGGKLTLKGVIENA